MAKKNSKEMRGNDEPMLVKSHDIRLDEEYVNWIADIKHRYRSTQVKAAVKVNGEKLKQLVSVMLPDDYDKKIKYNRLLLN